jgi:hypothetical protein
LNDSSLLKSEFYEGCPPQGRSEAQRANMVFESLHLLIRRGGAPSGAAGFITNKDTIPKKQPNNMIFKVLFQCSR